MLLIRRRASLRACIILSEFRPPVLEADEEVLCKELGYHTGSGCLLLC